MPALLRCSGSAGTQALSRSFLSGQGLRPGGIWQLSRSADRQDQPRQSVHVFRGTSAVPVACRMPGRGFRLLRFLALAVHLGFLQPGI
jgi:hypothetical protein